MPIRLPLLASLSLVLALLGALPAQAAKRPASTINLVSPMRVVVGKTVVIRGTNFSTDRRGNTVIFQAPNGRSAFAKPSRAAARKLVVRVPGSVERLLVNRDSKGVGSPTRLKVRVLVKRRYGKLSVRRNSPVVVSALKSGAPASCGTGSDFDRDLIPNSTEAAIKTDPCNKDTDGDGVEDGFEQESARDLNQKALPYPGKRAYPNALDASDATDDYDGDALSLITEFRAWAKSAESPAPSLLQAYTDNLNAPAFGGPYGAGPSFGNHTLPLNYSDGDQTSVLVTRGSPEYRPYLDFNDDGILFDDERDADGDGLRNIDESHNRGAFDENDAERGIPGTDTFLLMKISHYSGLPAPCDEGTYEYKPVLPRPMLQPDYLDNDSDGDGVWDGNDDQDNDGVSNVDEVKPPHIDCGDDPLTPEREAAAIGPFPADGARNGANVVRAPYNPCRPYRSDVCTRYEPR